MFNLRRLEKCFQPCGQAVWTLTRGCGSGLIPCEGRVYGIDANPALWGIFCSYWFVAVFPVGKLIMARGLNVSDHTLSLVDMRPPVGWQALALNGLLCRASLYLGMWSWLIFSIYLVNELFYSMCSQLCPLENIDNSDVKYLLLDSILVQETFHFD